MKIGATCEDCGCHVEVTLPDKVTFTVGSVALCGFDYQKRLSSGEFDEMPKSLNFGNAMKLTIHGAPVISGVRVYEQSQDGLVQLRRHP